MRIQHSNLDEPDLISVYVGTWNMGKVALAWEAVLAHEPRWVWGSAAAGSCPRKHEVQDNPSWEKEAGEGPAMATFWFICPVVMSSVAAKELR